MVNLEKTVQDCMKLCAHGKAKNGECFSALANFVRAGTPMGLSCFFKVPSALPSAIHQRKSASVFTWDERNDNSLFRIQNNNTNFQFYDYFADEIREHFFKLETKLVYTKIEKSNFDSLFMDVLSMIQASIDTKKIYKTEGFQVILDYKENTRSFNCVYPDPIVELLGMFTPAYKGTNNSVTLFMCNIYETAIHLGVDPEDLMKVVYLHELAHFAVWKGSIKYTGGTFKYTAKKNHYKGSKYEEAAYHELYAQYITYKLIKNDCRLLDVFLRLNSDQPSIYKAWDEYKHLSIDKFVTSQII